MRPFGRARHDDSSGDESTPRQGLGPTSLTLAAAKASSLRPMRTLGAASRSPSLSRSRSSSPPPDGRSSATHPVSGRPAGISVDTPLWTSFDPDSGFRGASLSSSPWLPRAVWESWQRSITLATFSHSSFPAPSWYVCSGHRLASQYGCLHASPLGRRACHVTASARMCSLAAARATRLQQSFCRRCNAPIDCILRFECGVGRSHGLEV